MKHGRNTDDSTADSGLAADGEPRLLNQLKAAAIEFGLFINLGRTKVEFTHLVLWTLSVFRVPSVFHPWLRAAGQKLP